MSRPARALAVLTAAAACAGVTAGTTAALAPGATTALAPPRLAGTAALLAGARSAGVPAPSSGRAPQHPAVSRVAVPAAPAAGARPVAVAPRPATGHALPGQLVPGQPAAGRPVSGPAAAGREPGPASVTRVPAVTTAPASVVAAAPPAAAPPAAAPPATAPPATGVHTVSFGPPTATLFGGAPSPLLQPLFGVSVFPIGNETYADAVGRLQRQMGVLPLARIYVNGMLPAHWDDVAALRALPDGAAVVLSFKADMADLAAGLDDDRIRDFLDSRPDGTRVWLVLHHEPEDDVERGVFTAAQFRAATEHIAPVVRGAGAIPTTVLMQYTLDPHSGRDWHDYYTPGISVLGWDVYNTPSAGHPAYRSVAGIMASVQAVAQETGRPFGWAEIGSPCITIDPSCQGRADWLSALAQGARDAGAQFAAYWDRPGDGSLGNFDYTLNDAASQAAWRTAMHP